MKINLYTSGPLKVSLLSDEPQRQCKDLVVQLDIPPFTEPPDIIVWGSRAFVRVLDNATAYREAFAYTIPTREEIK